MLLSLKKVLSTSSSCFRSSIRSLVLTQPFYLKKININENEQQITIEGVTLESDRKNYLIKPIQSPIDEGNLCHSCPLCRLNLKRLDYSDVLILSQFIDGQGNLMFKKDTGLCSKSFKQVNRLVKEAQSAKLLPRPPDYVSHGPWDELNHYYEYPKRIRDRPKSIIQKEYWTR